MGCSLIRRLIFFKPCLEGRVTRVPNTFLREQLDPVRELHLSPTSATPWKQMGTRVTRPPISKQKRRRPKSACGAFEYYEPELAVQTRAEGIFENVVGHFVALADATRL